MALRTVVLDASAAPPPPRRTVVLRAGGPAPKGRVVDIIVGVIGVLLLVVAVALADFLPDKTYVNPQFRLSFVEAGAERGSESFDFVEGSAQVHEFTYDLPEGNIYSITLASAGFLDDVGLSNPDTFRIELFDPDGNQVGANEDITNPRPRPRSDNPAGYTYSPIYTDVTFAAAPLPTEQIVGGLSHTETEEQALARLEPQFRVDNGGTWTVRVTLISAGDCPDQDDPEPDPQQVLACRTGDPNEDPNVPDGSGPSEDGTDAGNTFGIGGLRYSYYIPDVLEVK